MMITQNKNKTVLTFAIMAVALLGSVANGTMIIDLIGDEVNTVGSNSTYGTETEHLAGLLNDPFAYDPDDPTSPMPQTTWEVGEFFHGTTTVLTIIAYDFDTIYTQIFVDLYGRSDTCCQQRDDSFDVEFYLGGTLQETVAGSIDDTFHDRVTASPGTAADSIRIVETAASADSFTLAEIRANGVDDPDLPFVDAGGDVVTWSGQEVQLAPAVVNNDSEVPQRTLSYLWNAEPVDGVEFSATDIEAPAVTITKTTDNPSPVKLTLEVTLEGKNPISNSMVTDVYDDACMAAKGISTAKLDPTDIDENCVTGLADFAELAEDWLEDYALTAPVPKL